MKTTLNADGRIVIPEEIRRSDRLSAGDSFELSRLMSGHYLLIKEAPPNAEFEVAVGSDGLPMIRADGVITSEMVKAIESQLS